MVNFIFLFPLSLLLLLVVVAVVAFSLSHICVKTTILLTKKKRKDFSYYFLQFGLIFIDFLFRIWFYLSLTLVSMESSHMNKLRYLRLRNPKN